MQLADLWFIFPVAFAVAVVAIGGGVGGGLFFVPFFSIVVGLGLREAIGTAILAQLAGASGGALAHARRGTIDWKYAGALGMVGIPGAVAGSFIGRALNTTALHLAFVAVLLIVAAVIARQPLGTADTGGEIDEEPCDGDPRTVLDRSGRRFEYCVRGQRFGMLAGFAAGTCVGLVGLGGGEINTPALRVRCGMHLRIAIATSTAVMVATGLAAASTRLPTATIVWPVALTAAAGTLLGSQVGSYVAYTLRVGVLRGFLAVVFVVLAGLMLVRVFLE